MAAGDLAKKLRLQSGMKALFGLVPEPLRGVLGELPEGAEPYAYGEGEEKPGAGTDAMDFALLFVRDTAELEKEAPYAMEAVKPDGLLWIAYPKKSSKIKTDISRDAGWNTVLEAGWEGVSLVALDDTWSAMRFRRAELVKRQSREASDAKRERGAAAPVAPSAQVLETPEDLTAAWNGRPEAAEAFGKLAPSHRKEYIRWITEAKREQTRRDRIAKTLDLLAAGKKSPWDKG